MTGSTRRSIVAHLLGASGLVLLAPPRAYALSEDATGELALPPSQVQLTRRLMRQLGADAVLEIRRSWDIAFVRQQSGIVVTGTQAHVAVDAPPQLAEIARIEQARSTAAMFPILLDDRGFVRRSATADTDTGAETEGMLAEAIAVAQRLIVRTPGPASRDAAVQQYLAQLQRAGTGLFDRLPGDLFFPAGAPIVRSGTLPLPDGAQGEFSLTYTAQTVPGTPWLAKAEREVTTRIGRHQRRSREEWIMAANSQAN